jgi:hypothetical protein
MEFVGTSTPESAMRPEERHHLEASLDLPPQFKGEGLQSLIRAAYEELLGSWASMTTNLLSFFRSKGLNVYDKLVDALDIMTEEDIYSATPIIPAVASVMALGTRA